MHKEISEIIYIKDHRELFTEASEWFSSIWKIPAEAYYESFEECADNPESIPQWYIFKGSNGEWVSGLGIIDNDFHQRTDLCPNICAVYVKEEYRKKGIARFMLDFVCDELYKMNISDVYLYTDHTDFYEKCGFDFYCLAEDEDGIKARLYHRKTDKNAKKENDYPHYIGKVNADSDYSDGRLPHIVGVSNYQVMRANREFPDEADGIGNTYNHAPDMTFFYGRFWIQYLSNPVNEHEGKGISLISSSTDGIEWSKPTVSFPPLLIPEGINICSDGSNVEIPKNTYAVMHQRTAFYVSSNGKLITTGFYGYSPNHEVPWEKNGIGRVVREVYSDGSFGDIYFLHLLSSFGWSFEKLPYKSYTSSDDKAFIEACDELLADRFFTQQFAEEHGNDDGLIYLKTHNEAYGKNENKPYQAFTWYHINENNVVALWKQAVVGISHDNGDTWHICRETSFATSGAKAWGQKAGKDNFIIAYVNNLSSEHRYPLAVATSKDGITFDNLCSVFGQTPPRRYEGLYKDFGPQYVRGISEGNAERPSDAVWLCHSVNKEDIWVTRIPLPIKTSRKKHGKHEIISPYADGWNIYSGKYSSVKPIDGELVFCDSDKTDYAEAELILPETKKIRISFDVKTDSDNDLYVELTDGQGRVCARIMINRSDVFARYTSVINKMCLVDSGYHGITVEQDCNVGDYIVYVDGNRCGVLRNMQKVDSVSRIIFRTKPPRKAPGLELRPIMPDIPESGTKTEPNIYYIKNVYSEEMN